MTVCNWCPHLYWAESCFFSYCTCEGIGGSPGSVPGCFTTQDVPHDTPWGEISSLFESTAFYNLEPCTSCDYQTTVPFQGTCHTAMHEKEACCVTGGETPGCVDVSPGCCNAKSRYTPGIGFGLQSRCEHNPWDEPCDPDTDPNCISDDCVYGAGCCLCNWCCNMHQTSCVEMGGIPDNSNRNCRPEYWPSEGYGCTGYKKKPRCERGLWVATKNRRDPPEELEPAPQDYFELSSLRAVAMIDRPRGEYELRRQWGRVMWISRLGARMHIGRVCGRHDRSDEKDADEANRCPVLTQTDELSLGPDIAPGYSVFGCAYRCVCPEKPC